MQLVRFSPPSAVSMSQCGFSAVPITRSLVRFDSERFQGSSRAVSIELISTRSAFSALSVQFQCGFRIQEQSKQTKKIINQLPNCGRCPASHVDCVHSGLTESIQRKEEKAGEEEKEAEEVVVVQEEQQPERMAGSDGVRRWFAALPVASLPVSSGSIPPLRMPGGNADEPGLFNQLFVSQMSLCHLISLFKYEPS